MVKMPTKTATLGHFALHSGGCIKIILLPQLKIKRTARCALFFVLSGQRAFFAGTVCSIRECDAYVVRDVSSITVREQSTTSENPI